MLAPCKTVAKTQQLPVTEVLHHAINVESLRILNAPCYEMNG